MVRPAGAGGHRRPRWSTGPQETAKALATPALKETAAGAGRDPERHEPGRLREVHRRRDEEVGHGREGVGRYSGLNEFAMVQTYQRDALRD